MEHTCSPQKRQGNSCKIDMDHYCKKSFWNCLICFNFRNNKVFQNTMVFLKPFAQLYASVYTGICFGSLNNW